MTNEDLEIQEFAKLLCTNVDNYSVFPVYTIYQEEKENEKILSLITPEQL